MKKIFDSITLGILLGIIIYYSLIYEKPIYIGPNSNVIKKMVFKLDNKYYILKPVIYDCNDKYKHI
jgi:hypothetical protein